MDPLFWKHSLEQGETFEYHCSVPHFLTLAVGDGHMAGSANRVCIEIVMAGNEGFPGGGYLARWDWNGFISTDNGWDSFVARGVIVLLHSIWLI